MVGILDDRKGIQAVTLAGSALHGELNACVLPPSRRHNNGHKKNIFSLLQGNRKTLERKCEKQDNYHEAIIVLIEVSSISFHVTRLLPQVSNYSGRALNLTTILTLTVNLKYD